MIKTITDISKANGIKNVGFCAFDSVREHLLECRAKSRLPQNAKTIIIFAFPYKIKENKCLELLHKLNLNFGCIDMVKNDVSVEPYMEQIRETAYKAKNAGLNIDYFPTNFVEQDGKLFYIDYECNPYMQQWDFANWGIKYWSKTPEFLDYMNKN